MNAYPLTSFVTLATLLLLFAVAWGVGYARVRFKVPAPASSGPEGFDRAMRVQMNTVENALAFLPALWLAAAYQSDRVAAALGAVWVLARVWYAVAYTRRAGARGGAYVVSMIAWGGLMVESAIGVLRALIGGL